jgi:hypothetical protein
MRTVIGVRPSSEVWSLVIVGPQPAAEGSAALVVGAVGAPIGPLLEQGAVEPLHLAVRLRPVRPSSPVPHVEVSQCRPEQPAAVADPVVGEHAVDGDAVQGEPAVGTAPEPGAGLSPLVAQHLHIGQAGVVIDGGVQVVIAAA